MSFKNNKIQKFISGLIVISMLMPAILLFSAPKKTEAAGPVIDFITELFTGSSAASNGTQLAVTWKNVAQAILKQIIMTITNRILAGMTQATVNWINSGFHGSPLFLTNPQSFFQNIGLNQISDFVDLTGFDQLKFPFGRTYLQSLINIVGMKFQNNAQYSLSKVINNPYDIKKIRTNFNLGGWSSFMLTTQYTQNNAIGYNFMASDYILNGLQGVNNSAANDVRQ